MSESTLRVCCQHDAPIPLDVNFSVGAGDVLAIFGPSGSGKTTILRSIAGLYRPQTARIEIGGEVWIDTATGVDLQAHRRHVGLVFQDYALFPHLTAAQNVQTALLHLPHRERSARAAGLLSRLRLDGAANRRPHELSGGERQRVALARTLARDPRVLLLDEPFAAVDRSTRRHLRDEVDRLRRTLNVPTVLVTHDVDDVIRLATHLLVIETGRVVVGGTLSEVMARPDLPALRDALGLGSIIETRVESVDATRGLSMLTFDGGSLVAPHTGHAPGDAVRVRVPAREVILSDRLPEGLSLHNAVPGVVSACAASPGSPYVVVQLRVGTTTLLAEVTRDAVDRLGVSSGRHLFALVKSVSLEL
ncbi:MAG: molybdenum ABC transporter ATP-binding protein [Vicinamibacterales bacterium]